MKRALFIVIMALLLGVSTQSFADSIIIDNNKPMDELGTYPLCRLLDPATEGVIELDTDTSKLSDELRCPFPLSILVDAVPKNLESSKISSYNSITDKEHVKYQIPYTFFSKYSEVIITAIPKRVESDFRYNSVTGIKEVFLRNIILYENEVSFVIATQHPSKNTFVLIELLTKIEVNADVNPNGYDDFNDKHRTRIDFFEKITNALQTKRPIRMKGHLRYSDYVGFSEENDRLYIFFTVTKIE